MRLMREYINYWLKAKNRHGVHSPYVYDFNDKCLRLQVPEKAISSYSSYRKQLNRENLTIKVSDFGAGSKKLGADRKIKDIARVSGSPIKYAKLIYKIVNHYKPNKMLELGTSLGLGTMMMKLGHPKGEIHTVEGCPQTLQYTMDHFPLTRDENLHFHNARFDDFIERLDPNEKFDFIFIDGDHRGERTQSILMSLKRHLHDETVILLDDIRWSFDMQTFWKSMTQSENYNVSIDLFKMGVLVPRHHQATENFVIRY